MTQHLQTEKDSQITPSAGIPVVTSLEQVELIQGASLEYLDLGIQGVYPYGTIVISMNKANLESAAPLLLVVFIINMIFALIFLIGTGDWIVTLASLFPFGFALGLFFFVRRSLHSKTWIGVDHDYLYCMRGMKLNSAKMKRFPRNTQDTDVLCTEYDTQSGHFYDINLISAGVELKLASQLSQFDAQQIERMIKTVLSAPQLENA